jgi:rSAM/selenodomain-associated transferase 2
VEWADGYAGAMKKFSFIIPVLNEADHINSLIDHVRSLPRSDECELIIVDGSPGGDTIKAINRGGVSCYVSERGRAIQMNSGACAATGEFLIFLHADTRLPHHALTLIEQAMVKENIDGGAFDLRIDSDRLSLRFISRVASLRSRLTRIPYGDQAIFIRKNVFNRLGQYPLIPLMEDVALMRSIKKAGGRICIVPERAITSARRWEEEGIIFATLRNWCLITAYVLGVAPDKLQRYYRYGRGLYGSERRKQKESGGFLP